MLLHLISMLNETNKSKLKFDFIFSRPDFLRQIIANFEKNIENQNLAYTNVMPLSMKFTTRNFPAFVISTPKTLKNKKDNNSLQNVDL